MDALRRTENAIYRLLDIGIQVDGVDDLDARVPLRHSFKRQADVFETLSKTFAPVAGH